MKTASSSTPKFQLRSATNFLPALTHARAQPYAARTLPPVTQGVSSHTRPSPATLAAALALVLAAFVVTRLPFLIDWRLPLAFPDTATYLWPLETIESGGLPRFDLRTAGYPLFWWLCRWVSHNIDFVIHAQMTISFVVSLACLAVMWKYRPRLVLSVAVGLAVFVSANAHLMWDVALLSESIFTSALLVWMVALFLAMETRSVWFLGATSVAGAVAVSLRPSAVHLLGVMFVLAVWMYRQQFGARRLAVWLGPVVAAVAAMVLYNQVTIRIAALSGGSTWAYLWSTTLYLDPDPQLLPQINEAVAAKNAALSERDRAIIYGATDLRQFRDAVERNIGAGIGQIADRLTGWPSRTGWRYMEYRAELQQAVRTSIRRRPRVYLRNLVGTFLDNFRFIAVPHPNYYVAFPATDLYRDAFVAPPFWVRNLGGYYNPPVPSGVRVEPDGSGAPRVVAPESRLARLYAPFSDWRSRIFENAFWSWTVPASGIAVLLLVVRERRLSIAAIVWLAFLAAVAGNAFMAALIGHTEPRYAQPLHIMNYLAVAFLPPYLRALKGRS
jgi:hypothetical protein